MTDVEVAGKELLGVIHRIFVGDIRTPYVVPSNPIAGSWMEEGE